METPLADLDTRATLARAASATRRRRAVEVEDLEVLSHWAVLHGDPDAVRPGDRLRRFGGEGTPELWELSTAEIAIERQVHPASCDRAIADVLDLQHRLPLTWNVVRRLDGEVWVARRVAAMSRALPLAVVGVVDRAVSAAIAGQAPSRVLAICEAKVIEADPGAHQAKLEEQRRTKYLGLGRVDEFGLRHLVARVEAGDAVWIDATADRVADILAKTETDEEPARDELRAEAMGWLARPAELLALPLEHGTDDQALMESRATAFPADLLDQITHANLARLRPRAKLYLHCHRDVLAGETTGVVQVEGLGPMLPDGALELLARTTRVDIQPVIDLAEAVSVNAYEHPDALAERVHLLAVGDYFPYATCLTRDVDLDHPAPYDPGGPPGQTGTHNSGPLTRRHHRAKTHAGYTAEQIGPGRYLWHTPHGRPYLVDHTGTRRLPKLELVYSAA
jgi:hypothetical protein